MLFSPSELCCEDGQPLSSFQGERFRPPNQEMRLDRLTAQGHLAEWHVDAAIVVIAIASARVFVLFGSAR